MALFVLAVSKGLYATFRTVLERVCLVYKQSVYAQLLKGNHIVLSIGCPEFIQSRLQSFPGLFHLFDGETFAILGFHLSNGVFDFINLGSQNPLLPFCGHRNFLKLGMPDDDCIVICLLYTSMPAFRSCQCLVNPDS